MNPIYDTYIPENFSTINSYLMVSNPAELIDFLKKAFYAEEKSRTMRGDVIANVILQIGHSSIMVSQARGEFNGMKTSFYLYVNDVDLMHQRALDHGATENYPPGDQDYGDRQSGVIDPSGNYWWISTRLVEGPYEEG